MYKLTFYFIRLSNVIGTSFVVFQLIYEHSMKAFIYIFFKTAKTYE